jgi:hypothetical protein
MLRLVQRVADWVMTSSSTFDFLASTLKTVHLSSTSLATSSLGHPACLAVATGANVGRRTFVYYEPPPATNDLLLTGASVAAKVTAVRSHSAPPPAR